MRSSTLALVTCAFMLGCAGEPLAPDAPNSTAEPTAGAESNPPRVIEPEKPAQSAETQSSAVSAPESLPVGDVDVNGQTLGLPDLREIEARVGAVPQAGHFWYDAQSGLWGLIGHGAGGLTMAGLRAAPLAREVSAGSTAVLVNGREITQGELAAIAALLDWPLTQPGQYTGRYRLDAKGAFYGPSNRYLGNLKQAANKRAPLPTGVEPCILLRLSKPAGSLGREVTLECD